MFVSSKATNGVSKHKPLMHISFHLNFKYYKQTVLKISIIFCPEIHFVNFNLAPENVNIM